jgi:hypothetical protein
MGIMQSQKEQESISGGSDYINMHSKTYQVKEALDDSLGGDTRINSIDRTRIPDDSRRQKSPQKEDNR